MRPFIIGICLLVFACVVAGSQMTLAQGSLRFEVASVKPAGGNVGVRSADSQQVRYTGVRLRSLLQDAYQVKTYQVNGPAWLVTERYDVVAKLPEGASK